MRSLVAGCAALILSIGPTVGEGRASSVAPADGERAGTVKVVGRFAGREGQLNATRVLIADDFVAIGDRLEERTF